MLCIFSDYKTILGSTQLRKFVKIWIKWNTRPKKKSRSKVRTGHKSVPVRTHNKNPCFISVILTRFYKCTHICTVIIVSFSDKRILPLYVYMDKTTTYTVNPIIFAGRLFSRLSWYITSFQTKKLGTSSKTRTNQLTSTNSSLILNIPRLLQIIKHFG